MGGGALIQLVAYGVQNVFLTGSPQITYFKSIYRRYTNFAIESIQQDIIGNLVPGGRVSVTIQRNGDLLKNIVMQYNPSKVVPIAKSSQKINSIVSNLGHAIIKEYEIEIGGQIIDRQYGLWLTIWRDLTDIHINESTLPIVNEYGKLPPFASMYNKMAYTYDSYGFTGRAGPNTSDESIITTAPVLTLNTDYASTEAYVPMRFWFCQNPGLALPLIALQYHEVKFNMLLANKENIVNFWNYQGSFNEVNIDFTSIKIYTDYIFLDSTERAKFADNQHEYLIEQLQYDTYTQNKNISSSTYSIPLTFKHPVKELFFCGKPNNRPDNYIRKLANGTLQNYIERGCATYDALVFGVGIDFTGINLSLTFNQLPRFSPRNLKYFTREQMWEYHIGAPIYQSYDGLGCYSFALQPGEHQPSGTCNFSRIENPRLVFTNIDYLNDESMNDLCLFAINYNVLRIGYGMGSLVFSS